VLRPAYLDVLQGAGEAGRPFTFRNTAARDEKRVDA
jgi:hypothetical protein